MRSTESSTATITRSARTAPTAPCASTPFLDEPPDGHRRSPRAVVDDEGCPVPPRGPVRRVVSIVPSLTEAVAATDRNLLVGTTDWCTHPADLDVVRVRGTKNPDVERIIALRPDLVLANAEENRQPDLDALRAAGVAVYVTDIRTLDGAFAALRRMLAACGLAVPAWLADAEA